MYKPTLIDIIRKACEIAEMDPDHIYDRGDSPKCTYVEVAATGTEACLFGQAYSAYEIPREALASNNSAIGNLHRHLAAEGLAQPLNWTDRNGLAVNLAMAAQSEQDRGHRWGDVAIPLRAFLDSDHG